MYLGMMLVCREQTGIKSYEIKALSLNVYILGLVSYSVFVPCFYIFRERRANIFPAGVFLLKDSCSICCLALSFRHAG